MIKKNIVSIFGLCLFTLFHGVSAAFQDVNIDYANHDRIAHYELILNESMKTNAFVRLGLKTTAGAVALAACIAMAKGFSIVSGADLNLMNQRTGQHEAQIAVLLAAINNQEVVIDPLNFANLQAPVRNGWGSMIGNIALNLVCGAAFNHSMQFALSKIFFDKSILWFVQEKTTKHTIDRDLQLFKQEVVAPVKEGKIILTAYACEKFSKDIVRLYNMCVDNTERVVAYMQYRLKQIEKEALGKFGDQYIGAFLLQSLADVSAKMDVFENLFVACVSEKQKMDLFVMMFDQIDTYVGHMGAIIQMFASMEQKIEQS